MVFADLNTIENDMSSMAAGGGLFPNLNSTVSQSNPQINSTAISTTIATTTTTTTTTTTNTTTTTATTNSSNEITIPSYDSNDPRAVLKTLIRFIMRSFYDIPKSLVIEYIYHHERIKQQDLADRLCLDPKQVRSFIQEFKRDKFIIEDHRLESNDSTTGRRNQDQYYYKIDTTTFINVVRYRLINMQNHIKNLERQQTYRQSNYKCEQCGKDYTELDIGRLSGHVQDTLICYSCGGNVHEDIETKETTTTNREIVNMSLFNEQMGPIFRILAKIDEIMKNEQQMKNPSDQEIFQQNGNSSGTHHPINRDATTANSHRSQPSNIFDRTATINHDIQIIIEKDDDDYHSQMDIDETSNTDSTISSSRGPGKPGKKSLKTVQSAAEVATQSVPTKMKLTNKKVSNEPKPLPHWFLHSTVYDDHEEQHRLNNTSLNTTTHSATFSRQLSNQKLIKSATIQDIKQMLLVYESRKNKTLTLTPMEDSLSPPTPNTNNKID